MDTWYIIALSFLVGTLLPILFVYFLPNEKFYNWGYLIGQNLSTAGKKLVGESNWEKFENNLTGSFFSFSQGLKEGADSDE